MEPVFSILSMKPEDTCTYLYHCHQEQLWDFKSRLSTEFLYPDEDSPTTLLRPHGVRPSMLDVPTFDGDSLTWSTFGSNFALQLRITHNSQTLRSYIADLKHADSLSLSPKVLNISGWKLPFVVSLWICEIFFRPALPKVADNIILAKLPMFQERKMRVGETWIR